MKNLKRKSLLKFLNLPVLGLLITVPFVSCYYGNVFNHGDSNIDNGSSTSHPKAELDVAVVNSKKIDSGVSAKQSSSNSYGLTQNYVEFAKNGDFSSYNGLNTNGQINDDILGYLNYLFYLNNKNFSIQFAEVNNLSLTNLDENQNIVFNQSQISFDLSATITSVASDKFTIGDETINLGINSSTNILISVKDQVIQPNVQEFGKKFYLGWQVPTATLSTGSDDDVTLNNFSPTKDSFSKAFFIEFNNLSDVQTYFDLKSKYTSEFDDLVDSQNVKNLVEQKIEEQTSSYFDYVDIAKNLVDQIVTDVPITTLIQNASQSLIGILVKVGIIPQYFESFLVDALQSDATSNNPKTLLQAICDNKNSILSFLKENFGSAYDIFASLIQDLTPEMTTNNPSYIAIMNYLNKFSGIDEEIKNIIVNDILGMDSHPKSLIQILLDNFDFITSKIKSSVGNNPTLNAILSIIQIIFKTDSNGSYVSIYDSLVGSDEAKKQLIESISSLLPANVSDYINILIGDNVNCNKQNLLLIFESFAQTLDGLFAYKEGVTSSTPYEQRYANLEFSKQWIASPTVDKKDEQAFVSFNYQIKFSIINEVDFNAVPLKNLVSQDSFNQIFNKIASMDNSIINQILNTGIYPSLRTLILNFIPDSFKLGAGGKETNGMCFTYSANNEQIWFDPIYKDSVYYLGFSVGYNTNIFYDDPAFWKDIGANPNYIKGVYQTNGTNAGVSNSTIVGYSAWYYDFWKSILQNVLMRSYNFESRLFVTDYNTKVANYSTYNPNYYYTNLTISNNSNSVNISDLVSMFDLSNAANYQEQTSSFNMIPTSANTILWGNSFSQQELVKGITPIASQDNLNTLESKMYSFVFNNQDYANLGYNIDFSFDPIFNFTVKMEFELSIFGTSVHPIINFDIALFQSNLYLPINFYDVANKQIVNSISKTYFALTPTFSS